MRQGARDGGRERERGSEKMKEGGMEGAARERRRAGVTEIKL